MAIHHVEMQNGAPALNSGKRLRAKLREIGRKNGRREFNHCGTPSP
jgi:hypothetical protein